MYIPQYYIWGYIQRQTTLDNFEDHNQKLEQRKEEKNRKREEIIKQNDRLILLGEKIYIIIS